MASRSAVGEVVGSVSMLAITMALLGGASYLAMSSIDGAASLVGGSAQQQAREAGLLVAVVGTESNATGAYVWLFDYGWESSPLGSVFLNSQPVSWASNCGADWTGALCVLSLPSGVTGLVTLVIGAKSIEVSL